MKKAIIIIGILTTITATAQVQYRTKELQRLAKVIMLDTPMLTEGYSHPTANGYTLTVHQEKQTIDHIGLQLFSDELRAMGSSPIFDFLERYFLQLKYPPTVKTASNMIRDDEFRFITGSMAIIDDIRTTDGFTYSYDNHRYTATWNRENNTLLSVSFPVEYELISGENKIEAEENLLSDVQKAIVKQQTDDALQNDHYINEHFVNRLYFNKGKLIVDGRHPAETAANMMLSTNTQGNYEINMTQISYGFRKKTFQVPLRQWIAFCQNSGCQLFFGIESFGKNDEVNAVVLAVNQAENYNHVLTISIQPNVIDSNQGVIEARLYPYVPMHNVQNMFASYRKSNPKTFVSR